MSNIEAKVEKLLSTGKLESILDSLGYKLKRKDDVSYTVSAHYDYIDISDGTGIVYMNLSEEEYEKFSKMSEDKKAEKLEEDGEVEVYDVVVDDHGSLKEISIVKHD